MVSYRHNAMGTGDPLLCPHPTYLALAPEGVGRRRIYADLVAQGVPGEQLAAIRLVTQRQRAFGSDGFRKRLEVSTGLRAGLGRPGRPPRQLHAEKVL